METQTEKNMNSEMDTVVMQEFYVQCCLPKPSTFNLSLREVPALDFGALGLGFQVVHADQQMADFIAAPT